MKGMYNSIKLHEFQTSIQIPLTNRTEDEAYENSDDPNDEDFDDEFDGEDDEDAAELIDDPIYDVVKEEEVNPCTSCKRTFKTAAVSKIVL